MLSSKVAAFIQSEKLAATLVSRAYVTIHQPPPDKPNTRERKTREETVHDISEATGPKQVLEKEGVDPALEIAKRHAKEAVGIAENVIKGKSADAPQQTSQTEKIVTETIGKTAEQAKSTAKAAKEKITDTMKKASEKIFGARQVGESRPPEKRLEMNFLKPMKIIKPNMMEQASASSWYNYRRKKPKKDKESLDPYTPGVTPDLYKTIENQSGLKEFENLDKKDKASLNHSMLEAYKNLKNPKNSWPFYHSK